MKGWTSTKVISEDNINKMRNPWSLVDMWCNMQKWHFRLFQCEIISIFVVCKKNPNVLKKEKSWLLQSELWSKSNMTKPLKIVPSRIGASLSQNNKYVVQRADMTLQAFPLWNIFLFLKLCRNFLNRDEWKIPKVCKSQWCLLFNSF